MSILFWIIFSGDIAIKGSWKVFVNIDETIVEVTKYVFITVPILITTVLPTTAIVATTPVTGANITAKITEPANTANPAATPIAIDQNSPVLFTSTIASASIPNTTFCTMSTAASLNVTKSSIIGVNNFPPILLTTFPDNPYTLLGKIAFIAITMTITILITFIFFFILASFLTFVWLYISLFYNQTIVKVNTFF